MILLDRVIKVRNKFLSYKGAWDSLSDGKRITLFWDCMSDDYRHIDIKVLDIFTRVSDFNQTKMVPVDWDEIMKCLDLMEKYAKNWAFV